jgi:hypothetical protein
LTLLGGSFSPARAPLSYEGTQQKAPNKEEEMKKALRQKKLVLKVETLRQLEANQLQAAKGGDLITNWECDLTTTIFSEGACETYTWFWSCR